MATALGLSGHPGEILGHGPVSANMVRRLLPDATLRRLIVDAATGQPLHLDPTAVTPRPRDPRAANPPAEADPGRQRPGPRRPPDSTGSPDEAGPPDEPDGSPDDESDRHGDLNGSANDLSGPPGRPGVSNRPPEPPAAPARPPDPALRVLLGWLGLHPDAAADAEADAEQDPKPAKASTVHASSPTPGSHGAQTDVPTVQDVPTVLMGAVGSALRPVVPGSSSPGRASSSKEETGPLPGEVWLLDPPQARHDPTLGLARFLRNRDPLCTGPGCSVPAGRCDLDHEKPYGTNNSSGTTGRGTTGSGTTGSGTTGTAGARGGSQADEQGGLTTAANLSPKSRRCHRAKTPHASNPRPWTSTRSADGSTTWTSPLGRTHTRPGYWNPPPTDLPATTRTLTTGVEQGAITAPDHDPIMDRPDCPGQRPPSALSLREQLDQDLQQPADRASSTARGRQAAARATSTTATALPAGPAGHGDVWQTRTLTPTEQQTRDPNLRDDPPPF